MVATAKLDPCTARIDAQDGTIHLMFDLGFHATHIRMTPHNARLLIDTLEQTIADAVLQQEREKLPRHKEDQ
jgi:hypothetical protein